VTGAAPAGRETRVEKTRILRLIVGGSGGQGILTVGKVFAYAAINRGLDVSCLPAYGAEMRGGYVYCTIVMTGGDESVSPVVSRADIGLFMDEKSCRMLSGLVRKDGWLILNSSLIGENGGRKQTVFDIPATEMAEKLGDIRTAGMICAGAAAFLVNRRLFPFKCRDLTRGMGRVVAGEQVLEMNERAVFMGWDVMKERFEA